MSTAKATSLGEAVRQAREEAGLSVRALAASVGVSASNITRLEAGEHQAPSASLLQRVADVLEIDSSDLLAFIGVKPSLPEPRTYFRRAYGMSDKEAREAVRMIEQLHEKHNAADNK